MDKITSFRGCLYHLCKISRDGSLVFYSTADFLVFTSTVFAYARKYGVTITEFCIMLNHFHIAAYAGSRKDIEAFYSCICSQFSRMYNKKKGKVRLEWKKGINISEKWTMKDKRSLYVYIANNAPAKKYCSRAENYRWSFLKPAAGNQETDDRICSQDLQLAKAITRDSVKFGRPLTYEFFDHFFTVLPAKEKVLLTDYVLETVVDINLGDIIEIFDSKEEFLDEAEKFNGKDFDIDDDFTKENYRHYSELTREIRKLGLEGNDSIIHESDFDLYGLVQTLACETDASNREISRFLHIPLAKIQTYTCREY